MDTIGPSPFRWLEFDAGGSLVDPGAPAAIETMLNAPENHGPGRGLARLEERQGRRHEALRRVVGQRGRGPEQQGPQEHRGRRDLWPAKQFSTDFDDAAAAAGAAGGTLSAGDGARPGDLSDAEFEAKIEGGRGPVRAASGPRWSPRRARRRRTSPSTPPTPCFNRLAKPSTRRRAIPNCSGTRSSSRPRAAPKSRSCAHRSAEDFRRRLNSAR